MRAVAERRLGYAALAAALLLAALLRLLQLEAKPLWNDEAFGLRVAMQPLSGLLAAIEADVHPPLYYFLLHLWLPAVPWDATGRLLSALLGFAAVVVAWLIARRVLAPLQVAAAVALCAVVPLHVSWSQVSRGYALLLIASVLALFAAGRVLTLLEGGGRERGRLVAWGALYAASAAASLWSHNIATLLLLGINAAAGWRLLTGQLRFWRPVIGWSLCQVGAFLLWAPWLPSLLEQTGRLGLQHFVVTVAGMLERGGGLVGGFMLWKLAPVAVALGLGAALLGLARLDRRSAEVQLGVAATVVPVLACVLLFFAGKPAFGYSLFNLIWAPVSLAIAMAANLPSPGQRARLRRLLGSAMALGFFLLSLRGVANWYAVPNPDWSALALRLAAEARPGDTLLAQTALTPDAGALARGEVPMHALDLAWTGLRGQRPDLPLPSLPPGGTDEEMLRWMQAQRRIWVPRTVPIPPATLAARAVALAAAQPAAWEVSEERVGGLGLTLIRTRPPG